MKPQAVLDGLLRRLDEEYDGASLFGVDWVEDWPLGLLEEFLAGGLIQPAEPARFVRCPDCQDDHVEEVEYVPFADSVRAYVRCPELGRAPVVLETLLRWCVDGNGLASAIRDSLRLDGHLTERVQGRVWQLGSGQLGEAGATVFFVRGLGWADGAAVTAGRGLRTILTPGDAPSRMFPDDVVVAGLSDLASWTDGTLAVNRGELEARVRHAGGSPHQADTPAAVRKTGGRRRIEDDPVAQQLYEEGERLHRKYPKLTRPQIAGRLGISESTYKRYVSRFSQTTGVEKVPFS